ncbi:MAG TPA: saccharopine dehydrogenase C-terminal domain-containing protein [Thermoanaerobaculia bacterium]|nr:saccharopine dehydrogenase C-terminal domain-containing protein [Thermoanaerobaculia bacterium]
MKKIAVLGCGLVGAAIARDLSREPDFEVTAADSHPEALGRLRGERLRAVEADLSSASAIARIVEGADAVVGALPGRLGFAMLETVVRAGKPISDISFSPEDPLHLDDLARGKGVTAVVDCGVSPGLSNFAVGRAAAGVATVEEVTIRVGGLPRDRRRPFEYAVVFSPTDVLEEYTRPARIVEEGQVVTRPALSEVETLEVPGVGTMEGFLTDGLRTLLATIPARSMKEKTLRYPGHADAMRSLRESGFFDAEPIDAGGVRVSPRAVTENLLGRAWKLGDGEEEITFMAVDVAGRDSSGSLRRYRFELLDRTAGGVTSMARTTGFPCSAAAAMLARGEYREPGIQPLEKMAADPFASARFLDSLRSRGLVWTERWEDKSR